MPWRDVSEHTGQMKCVIEMIAFWLKVKKKLLMTHITGYFNWNIVAIENVTVAVPNIFVIPILNADIAY